jgi:Trypsin-like peptidase domain
MCGRIARVAVLVCAAVASPTPPAVGADSDVPATNGSHESIENRLVYIEARRIKAEQYCDEKSFDEMPPVWKGAPPEKGTGFLLSDERVLTDYHVALEAVPSGFIRCYAVYRDKARGKRYFARPYTSKNLTDDGVVQLWAPRDLAMLTLTRQIDDQSLKTCPRISTRRLDRGDRVFIWGYKGDTIDLLAGKPITDPQVHPTTILRDCKIPELCNVDQPVPAGVSGGPVVNIADELVGLLKGGDSAQSQFQPVMDLRGTFLTYCPPVKNDQNECTDAERQIREKKQTLSVSKKIQCSAAGEADDTEPLNFVPPDGFKISGFAKHDDQTDDSYNGWVGYAEYTLSDDGLRVTEVKIQLGCNGRPTASGKSGWAETIMRVDIKKILKPTDIKDIDAKCHAYD